MADPSYRHDNQEWQLQNRGQEAIHNFKTFLHNKAPSTPQAIAALTIFPFAASLLFLAGLAFTGSVIGLAVTTPLLIIFSPVIIPAVLTLALAVMGFLTSGAFGLMGLSTFSWILNCVRSRIGLEQVTRRARETAGHVGHKVKEVGQDVSRKAQETSGKAAQDGTDKARDREAGNA